MEQLTNQNKKSSQGSDDGMKRKKFQPAGGSAIFQEPLPIQSKHLPYSVDKSSSLETINTSYIPSSQKTIPVPKSGHAVASPPSSQYDFVTQNDQFIFIGC